MAFINVSKPSGNIISNSTKVSVGETWRTDPYTWAQEPRTWRMVSQLLSNITKVSSSFVNTNKP